MKKILIYLSMIFLMFSCVNKSQEKEEIIKIYNYKQELIKEVKDKETLDYFSILIGKSTENMGNNSSFPLVKIPEDAEKSLTYEFIKKREDGKIINVKFFVYSNYKYLTLKMPVIPEISWELSDEDYEKLTNLEKINN
ncbi:hypothetical protein [Oceanivirga salmonicida]|uniref:hypothetical protein n=1 Tax=Oceanivirga salmonicida TaxID=1769291 RepID=UPI0008315500|nr:hypothetical protein [Oceanivirga salmonicida]